MRIHLLSDLHLEFETSPKSSLWQPAPGPCTQADVVVLAGDVHTKARGVVWAAQHFRCPVLYVPGNHEYYGGALGYTLAKMRALAAATGVHVLDDEVLELEGVRFVGSTLWTDFALAGDVPAAMQAAREQANDYRRIRTERFWRLRPELIAARHARSRQFLVQTLATPFAGPTVVITHHAPSVRSLGAEAHRLDALDATDASALDALVDRATLWLHGHTHVSRDYRIGDCRVVCNPRGYAPFALNPEFDPELLLELPLERTST